MQYRTNLATHRAVAIESFRYLIPITAVCGLLVFQLLGPIALTTTFIGLAGWAATGPRRAIQALSLVWIPGFLNPEFFDFGIRLVWWGSQTLLVLKWCVLIAAFGACLWRIVVGRQPFPTTLLWLTLFVATVGVSSTVTSFSPDVSATKLVSFWLGAATVLFAFRLTRHEWQEHLDWFTGLGIVLVAINVPLLLVSGSYRESDNLFQGLFLQPQVTGLVFATLSAWLCGRCLVEARLSWPLVLCATGALSVLWPTGSRTAVLALVLSLFAAAVLTLIKPGNSWRGSRAFLFRPRIAITGVAAIFLLGSFWPTIVPAVGQFFQKREVTVTLDSEEIFSSREHLIQMEWDNFQRHPLFGNGFGVPSSQAEAWILRDPTLGVPVSSVTEKGFLPTSVLEETGLAGATILSIALFSLFGSIVRVSSFPRIWMALTAFAVNFGEATFFSFGGIGTFLWLLLGFATIPEVTQPVATQSQQGRSQRQGGAPSMTLT